MRGRCALHYLEYINVEFLSFVQLSSKCCPSIQFLKRSSCICLVLPFSECTHRPRADTRDTMRILEVEFTASLLLCSCVAVTSSRYLTSQEPATVTHDGITFEIVRYRHGRSSVSFEDDDISSEYIYNFAGYVATIEAGSEEYKVEYDSDGDVDDVERRDDRRTRALRVSNFQDEYVEGVLEDIEELRRRKAKTCEDCKEAWDTVCGDGLESLCDLQEKYGSEFGPLGEESIDTMCTTFASACDDNSEREACEDQCDSDDGDDDDDDSSDDDSSDDDSSDDDDSDEDDDDDDDDAGEDNDIGDEDDDDDNDEDDKSLGHGVAYRGCFSVKAWMS